MRLTRQVEVLGWPTAKRVERLLPGERSVRDAGFLGLAVPTGCFLDLLVRRCFRCRKGLSPAQENMNEDFVRVARPRVQRLSVEMEREATMLLAGLLADAVKKRVVFPSTFVRVKRGLMSNVRPPAKKPGSSRDSAKRQRSRSVTKVGD